MPVMPVSPDHSSSAALRKGVRDPGSHSRGVWRYARSLARIATVKTLVWRARRTAVPIRVVIGASSDTFPGWISTDVDSLNVLNAADWRRYFSEGDVDAILAEHVWEYFSPADAVAAARFCHEFLRPGGYLRVAVPDGFHPDPAYQAHVAIGASPIRGQGHQIVYNSETFAAVFESIGFVTRLLEYFDRDGRFHATAWDPGAGRVQRSSRFDHRNWDGALRYTSIILDASKR